MAFAFSSALQPPVRAAAAPSQSVLEPPRPRLDTVTAALNSAFASFAGFSVPRFAVEERTQLSVAREVKVPKAASADGGQDLAATLDWPDHFREAYKIGRTYGHGEFRAGILRPNRLCFASRHALPSLRLPRTRPPVMHTVPPHFRCASPTLLRGLCRCIWHDSTGKAPAHRRERGHQGIVGVGIRRQLPTSSCLLNTRPLLCPAIVRFGPTPTALLICRCPLQVLSKSRPQQTRARTVGKLLREAECLARVQTCDNVVSLRGIFEDASSAYLVMDHCSGGDLEQLLEVCSMTRLSTCAPLLRRRPCRYLSMLCLPLPLGALL